MKLRSLAALGLAFTGLSSFAAAANAGAGMGAQPPAAHIAALCSVGTGEGYNGYAYLLTLSVKRTTCATAMTLVRHHGKLSRWSCARKILERNSVAYDARETCKSGGRRVVYTYVVNT
jgi:hypothetical protein